MAVFLTHLSNQLVKTETGQTTVTYNYRADGLRLSKTTSGQTTMHVWDGSNIVADLNGSRQVVSKYIRGVNLIKSIDKNGNSAHYVYNAHGDVVHLAKQDGSVTNYNYDAFGVEVNPNPNDANPFRYCGEYTDLETNNIYLRNRFYTPGTGRFLTEDPIKDGLNWYTYCSNNPVMLVDPSGLVDVMVSYIAEKNGGSAIYSEENFFGLGSWNQKITITINGITRTYSIGEKDSVAKILSGVCIIDNSVLMSDFEIDDIQSTHQVGDSFHTIDHAAMAWRLKYYGESIYREIEYSSAIYGEEGNYKFTDPIEGTSTTVGVPDAPIGETLVAIIHTHPMPYRTGEHLSQQDKKVANLLNVPSYIITPTGHMVKYDPHKKKSKKNF